ncbi:hypothetical protein C1H76_0505 [Elsinoe australis]|uniref:Uncharacterized protein n=1 Tax=Elsinoe australis TaxID=40998 RepID=A0A4U7BAU3_9PEZI|nr:hypothetical protein C1H76_0505 [Elsinoe australis]
MAKAKKIPEGDNKALVTLQNVVAKPKPFCSFWLDSTHTSSPFSHLGPEAVSTLCKSLKLSTNRNLLKNPLLVGSGVFNPGNVINSLNLPDWSYAGYGVSAYPGLVSLFGTSNTTDLRDDLSAGFITQNVQMNSRKYYRLTWSDNVSCSRGPCILQVKTYDGDHGQWNATIAKNDVGIAPNPAEKYHRFFSGRLVRALCRIWQVSIMGYW